MKIEKLIEKYSAKADGLNKKALHEQHEKKNLEKAGEYFAAYNQLCSVLSDLRKLNIPVVSVSFKSSLENKVKSYKDDIKRNWENIISESEYNKLDGIEPFIRLIKLYSHKLEEVESIIDDFNKR